MLKLSLRLPGEFHGDSSGDAYFDPNAPQAELIARTKPACAISGCPRPACRNSAYCSDHAWEIRADAEDEYEQIRHAAGPKPLGQCISDGAWQAGQFFACVISILLVLALIGWLSEITH